MSTLTSMAILSIAMIELIEIDKNKKPKKNQILNKKNERIIDSILFF